MINPLRISNIVLTGKMSFKHKLREKEVSRLIHRGKFNWMVINEEVSPIIQAHIEKEGISVQKSKKNACISIWTSGAINIVGIQSIEEGEKIYLKVLSEIKKHCGRVLK